jgi:hypothetical protein
MGSGRLADALLQPKRSHDALQIIVSVVLDLDPATFLPMVHGDARAEMLLQAFL